MSVTKSSTPRTITVPSTGLILPTTIDPDTDMNLMVTAISLYHVWNERKVAYDTLEQVMEAMRDSSALIVQYVALDGEQTARCLWPSAITFTKEKNIVCKAYCTMRRIWKTFRFDRMLTCHALTMPGDAEEAA